MIEISTDKNRLNLDIIYNYLSKESYWAQERTIDVIKKSIENSLCFGVYKNNNQIGFARIVTDYAIFAWIMDVFILPEFQGKGYGKQLMSTIMNHEQLQNLKRWGLNTNDAHELYSQYGFKSLSNPKIMMELKN